MTTSDVRLTEEEFHRQMAVGLFNEVWRLLDEKSRSPQENDRMIHAAHASRLHWGFIGNHLNLAVGEWQISRVYSVLQRPDPALYHARRCMAICEGNGIEGFYLASAYEGLARALAADADRSCVDFIHRANQIAESIVDPLEKALLLADLESIRCANRMR